MNILPISAPDILLDGAGSLEESFAIAISLAVRKAFN